MAGITSCDTVRPPLPSRMPAMRAASTLWLKSASTSITSWQSLHNDAHLIRSNSIHILTTYIHKIICAVASVAT